jgi:hypothetical protein
MSTFNLHDLEKLKSKASINNGYYRVYYPEHPNAYSNGCVFIHRLVVENTVGRYLSNDEHIHHIDGDRLNNTETNLQLLTSTEHANKHNKKLEMIPCPYCLIVFQPRKSNQHYCSISCSNKDRVRIVWPSKEELELLVWEKPLSVLALDLGVSDTAIRKRCTKLGISKPPIGYWNTKYADTYKLVDKYGNVWPTKDELQTLVWLKPIKEIAKGIGVDPSTVSCRCKKFGIYYPAHSSYWKRKENRDY